MSQIDAMIAQGGGIDLPSIVTNAGIAKNNDLLNLGARQKMARADVTAKQEDTQYEMGFLAQKAMEFISLGENQDWVGAGQVIESIPDNLLGGKAAQMKAQYRAARLTPNPNDDIQALEQAKAFVQSYEQMAQMSGGRGGISADQQEFNAMAQNLTPEELERARRIRLGLDPRAMGSANQTITFQGTAPQVAQTEQILAEGKQKGTNLADAAQRPGIERAVQEQGAIGKAEGEIKTAAPLAEANASAAEIAERPARRNAALGQIRQLDEVFGELDQANKNTGFWTTGNLGVALRYIAPGLTDASALDANLTSIKAALSIEAMAGLKQLSAVGATGMGNQSNKEFTALESLVASLSQLRNPEEIRRALNKIYEHMTRIKQLAQVQVDLADGNISLDTAKQRANDISLRPRMTGVTGNNGTLAELTDGSWINIKTGELYEEPSQ